MTAEKSLRTILVVDDDADDFFFLQDAINSLNPQVEVKHISSCEVAKKYSGPAPDLVFLDLNMPDYDGFKWLNGIRNNYNKDLPVIVFTTSSNAQHIARAYHDGASLYFTKPDSFTGPLKGVKKILGMDWHMPARITEHFYNEHTCRALYIA